MAPVSWKHSTKKFGFFKGDAHGGKDDGKLLVRAPHLRLPGDLRRQIARGAGQRPEKIGSFWPRTSVFSPSMAEMPVWINSCG